MTPAAKAPKTSKVWFWRPELGFNYRWWTPVWFGGDELGRKTVVIGFPFTGRAIIAISKPDYLYPRDEE